MPEQGNEKNQFPTFGALRHSAVLREDFSKFLRQKLLFSFHDQRMLKIILYSIVICYIFKKYICLNYKKPTTHIILLHNF